MHGESLKEKVEQQRKDLYMWVEDEEGSIRISISRISFEKEKNDSGWVPPLPFSTPPDGAASPRVLLSEFLFAVFFFFIPKASFIILFPLL